MSESESTNRFAPPTAEVRDVATSSTELILGGRLERLFAVIIDGVISLAAVWLVSVVTPWDPFTENQKTTFLSLAINGGIGFGIFMALQGYLLAKSSQTIGKKILNLRIVHSNGEPIAFKDLVIKRYLITQALFIVPYLGPVFGLVNALSIFRDSRQCLHDNIADTIVIKV